MKDAYGQLNAPTYEPVYPQAGTAVEVAAQGDKRKWTSFGVRVSDRGLRNIRTADSAKP